MNFELYKFHCNLIPEKNEIKEKNNKRKRNQKKMNIKVEPEEIVTNEMELLFSESKKNYVKIKSKNCKKFFADKELLTKHSEFLKVYFEEYKNRNFIDMKKYESDVVLEMLRFIYTGQVSSLEKYVFVLRNLAIEYGLTSLKKFCKDEIFRTLI